ncbi:MAG: PAS domain S-box protein [Gemmatimonadota bacterium]|nr:PAS domain S-box protein [Gemmatimonadota bacterium]
MKHPRASGTDATLGGADTAREAAAAREAQLNLIYNSTHDCMFLVRVEGNGVFRCESVNRAYTTVTGIREQAVVGRTPQDVLPPEAAANAVERYQEAVAARAPITYTEDAKLPAGRLVFETILTPIVDAGGHCTHLLGALRDITARKTAEEALIASETRYRQLFESNGSVQFLVDVSTSRIVDVNPAAARFYGWTRDQMRGMKAADIAEIEEDDWKQYADRVSLGQSTATIRRHRLASGELRTVEVFAGEFMLDGARIFHSIVHDVSDRVQADEELRDSEARFRSALDNSPDLFAVLDTVRDAEGAIIDFRVVEVNARAGSMLGVDVPRMIGHSFGELLPYAANGALLRSLVAVAETGVAEEAEVQPRVGPLADKWLSCQIVPLGRGVVLTARDVTERRRTEDELRALSLVDELTGLFNRRGFDTVGAQQLKSAEHSTKSSFLFYFDMNDFKAINDTWGHAAGDEALIKMGDVLRQTFRETDVIARLGGDEFVALALSSGDVTEQVLHRLRAELSEQNERNKASGVKYILAAGVGVARFDPQSPRSLNMLLQIADRELYEDKRLGSRLTA